MIFFFQRQRDSAINKISEFFANLQRDERIDIYVKLQRVENRIDTE